MLAPDVLKCARLRVAPIFGAKGQRTSLARRSHRAKLVLRSMPFYLNMTGPAFTFKRTDKLYQILSTKQKFIFTEIHYI